ncbi:fukutin isoform X1 [Brachionus plicatilis]|uniref:Fukutin isoform X1 n=1 Tax=Brachionus plicatilis TaxID=10195 RepID=A0A3M7S5I4_BRAPC|nr:fukutin isoform X1 [Brachionus plicatilis]
MYPRGNFYWIPQDDFKIDSMTKSFSDFNRALNKFKTVVIEHKSRFFTVPLDTSHFLYQYKHSKFIECNQQLAESTYKIQKQNVVKTTFFVSRFNLLESNQKVYWLMAGTLLGWYRECGIIPHTTDADLSLHSDQFDPEIENFLINDKLIPLSLKFGLDNDSLEFRIGQENSFHIDLFFTYELNQTHQWFPYHSGRQVKRNLFSKFSGICSAELHEEKFLVPCDPVKVLNEIYGENGWQRPDKKFKVSPNLKAWKSWNLNQWLNAIKYRLSKDKHLFLHKNDYPITELYIGQQNYFLANYNNNTTSSEQRISYYRRDDTDV